MADANVKRALTVNLVVSYGSSVGGFLCMLIMAKALGAEEYGWIAMGLAVGRVLSHFVELGSQHTFVRDAVKSESSDDVISLAITSFGIRLTGFVACIAFITVFSALNAESGVTILGLFFASAWVLTIGLYPASWYDYSHQTKIQNLFIFAERVLALGICIVLFFLPDFMQVTLAVCLPLFFSRLMLAFMQARYWLKVNGRNVDVKVRLLKPPRAPKGLSYLVATAMLSNAILPYGNQIVLGLTPFKMQLPSYSIAFQIVGLIMIFQGQALRIFLREISETCKRRMRVRRGLLKHAMFLVIISAAMAATFGVASKYLLPLVLTGEEFAETPKFLAILGIWITIAGLGRVITQYILAFQLDSHYLKVSIFSGIMALVLGILFIPVNGAYAVAFILIGTHMAMIIWNAMHLIAYLNQHHIK